MKSLSGVRTRLKKIEQAFAERCRRPHRLYKIDMIGKGDPKPEWPHRAPMCVCGARIEYTHIIDVLDPLASATGR